jgi:hypothetical protein
VHLTHAKGGCVVDGPLLLQILQLLDEAAHEGTVCGNMVKKQQAAEQLQFWFCAGLRLNTSNTLPGYSAVPVHVRSKVAERPHARLPAAEIAFDYVPIHPACLPPAEGGVANHM